MNGKQMNVQMDNLSILQDFSPYRRHFEWNLGDVFRPPGPPILDQDGPCGLQILPNTLSWVKAKQIDVLVQSKSQIIMF